MKGDEGETEEWGKEIDGRERVVMHTSLGEAGGRLTRLGGIGEALGAEGDGHVRRLPLSHPLRVTVGNDEME